MSMFLTADEVAELTGRKRTADQLKWLLLRGWLPDAGWIALLQKIALYTPIYLALMWSLGMRNEERAMMREVLRRRSRP